MLQAKQREPQPQPIGAPAHLALLVTGHEGHAGGRQRALDLDRQRALADEIVVWPASSCPM
jgi:hypothetical protein